MTCAKGICLELLERWKDLPQYSGLSREIAQLVLHEQFCDKRATEREAESSAKLAQEDAN